MKLLVMNLTNIKFCISIHKMENCVICNKGYEGYGNNPFPLCNDGRCCDDCNNLVIGARMKNFLIREKFTGR